MKIYLASRYSRREELCGYRESINAISGIAVCAKWLDGEEERSPEMREVYARQDLKDIDDSQILIHFTQSRDEPSLRGGRHFESGYAYAKDKVVVVVGDRENIFLELPDVRQFLTFNECLCWLTRLAEDQEA